MEAGVLRLCRVRCDLERAIRSGDGGLGGRKS